MNNAPTSVIDPDTLTKVTVNCTPRAIAALDRVTDATGDSKTDSINRAIQLYALLATTEPGHGFAYEVKSGTTRHVWVTETHPGRSTFTFRLFGWWRSRK